MATEDITAGHTIASLIPTNPTGSDDHLYGDDHIRNIKKALQYTWPNVSATVSGVAAEFALGHKGGTISGDLVVLGNITGAGTLSVSGALVAKSTLTVEGAAVAKYTLTAEGALVGKSTLHVNGMVTFDNTLSVSSNAVVRGSLAANGITSSGNIVVNGSISASGNVVATGLMQGGALAIGGNATIGGALGVGSIATSGNIAANTLALSGDATIIGALYSHTATASNQVITLGQGDTRYTQVSLGVDQEWTNVSSTRTINSIYQNLTGKPISVKVYAVGTLFGVYYLQLRVGTVSPPTQYVDIAGGNVTSGNYYSVSAIIPPNVYYSFNDTSGSTVAYAWYELR